MSPPWIIITVLAVLVAVVVAVTVAFPRSRVDFMGVVLLVLVVVLGLSLFFMAGSKFFTRLDRIHCLRFGAQTEREVRFVDQSWGGSSCFVKTADGWIERDNFKVVEVDP